MSERREDLSTADLADQPPRDAPPRPDLQEGTDVDGGEGRAGDDLDQAPPDREPAEAALGSATAEPTHDPGAATAGPLLAAAEAEAFRARWTDIQTGFVDAPRQAVEQADRLVAELMQHLARTFADERQGLERQWDRGDDIATDDLRTAFQRYRSFFERLLAT